MEPSEDDVVARPPSQGRDQTDIEELAARAAAMQLESAASLAPHSPGLRLQIPNPFDPADGTETDEAMRTVCPVSGGRRVAAAPVLPQPPRFAGRTMQDQRNFMRQYETYLTAINALQTQWGGTFAMPVGACIETKTKRMVARYEFNLAPHLVGEEQWIGYFNQANAPTHVDYASVDEAMKKLRMKTARPEPESRMMSLQADLETFLDQFNLTELAFEHEQRRVVRISGTRMKCSWVTQLMREFMTWERAAQAASPPDPASQSQQPRDSGRGHQGGRSADAGRGGLGGQSGHNRSDGGRETRDHHDGAGSGPPVAPVAAGNDPKFARGACLKCNSADHQVRDCPRCQPGEAVQLLKARREQRDAARNLGVRRIDVVDADRLYSKANGVDVDHGTVDAKVDGVAVVAILLDSGADTSLVARGVLDALEQAGKSVSVRSVDEVQLNPVCGQSIAVSRQATFGEVVITASAGPLMLRNLTCYVEEENDSKDLTVGRPITRILGYSTDKLLVKAGEVNSEWELSPAELRSDNHGEAPLQRWAMSLLAFR
ncbi:unnamed protein product [Phytophthora fragariaefolia]|uniref:Unnamed protein product n=1 Tax=Phytophthora fragariaefolia TaxID=1490495 RepID=A0A9W7CRX4_9STRA|nr:unnamed protein product [Phytophthora fragariaefolia]